MFSIILLILLSVISLIILFSIQELKSSLLALKHELYNQGKTLDNLEEKTVQKTNRFRMTDEVGNVLD